MNNQQKSRTQLEVLRRQIARLEQARRCGDRLPVPSGCGPLDRLLPGRGFRRGTLAEWLAAGEGSGAGTLALMAARQACSQGGALVVLDRRREFHPPAAVRLGIEPKDLIVVQATGPRDNAWALDQALRCPGVGAVLAWPEELDGRTFRRLQLAAEESGSLGLLIRPEGARHEPSWAEVRLLVEPLPGEPLRSHARRLRIHLLRCRGAASGRNIIDVEIDDEAYSVHLVTRLAPPVAEHRPAGA